jgi:predicted DNA-binding transcriptional regulator
MIPEIENPIQKHKIVRFYPLGLITMGLSPAAIQIYSLIVPRNRNGKVSTNEIKERTSEMGISPATLKRRIKELVEKNIICRINKGEYGFIKQDFDKLINEPTEQKLKNEPTMVENNTDYSKDDDRLKNEPTMVEEQKLKNEPTMVGEKSQRRARLKNEPTRLKNEPTIYISNDSMRVPNGTRGRSPLATSLLTNKNIPGNNVNPCSKQSTLFDDKEIEKALPTNLIPFVELYHEITKKKIPAPSTKAMSKTVSYLKRLIKGTMFNDLSDYKQWHDHPFTEDDIFQAIMRHKKALQSDYEPENKAPLKRYLYEFIYNPKTKQKSYFLRWHSAEPKLLKPPKLKHKNPELEKYFLQYFNLNGNDINERNKVIRASEKIINFFHLQNIKVSQTKMGEFVINCLESNYQNNWAHAGHLASNTTLNKLLPNYLEDMGYIHTPGLGGIVEGAKELVNWGELEIEDGIK